MKLRSTNPSKNYQPLGDVEISTLEEVQNKVAAARRAAKGWRELGIEGRIKCLKKAVDHFEREKQTLARLITQEMGKPFKDALNEIEFAIEYFRSYFEKAEEYLKPELTHRGDGEVHEVHHEPYGVAAVIVPWNYPFSNFVWQTGQTLLAGNTVVFKHSEETPLFDKAIEEIMVKYLPDGVFNEVYGDGKVGEMLVNQKVDLICFTGSSKTGLKINQLAGGRMIKTVMELGGSAPGIVFEDADIDSIASAIFAKRFSNNGQMCDALKRLIVHESVKDRVIAQLTDYLKEVRLGDSEGANTQLGPLVAKRQLDLIKEQVADGVQKGAKIVTGGKEPAHLQGAFYEPTLVTGVTKEMRLWQEEVFGPVLPIVTFKTEQEAIDLANDTTYGLGAYIFTKDPSRFKRVCKELESGMICQNELSYVHPYNPFGGYKHSGNAREHSKFGFHEVSQVKVVSMEAA
jgi:succinate-semialdehyde dehydrogenase / glutarate-semialdehyde dehydrogenase